MSLEERKKQCSTSSRQEAMKSGSRSFDWGREGEKISFFGGFLKAVRIWSWLEALKTWDVATFQTAINGRALGIAVRRKDSSAVQNCCYPRFTEKGEAFVGIGPMGGFL